MTKREAKIKVLQLGMTWDPQGRGRVVRQEPAAGTPIGETQVCKLVFGRQ